MISKRRFNVDGLKDKTFGMILNTERFPKASKIYDFLVERVGSNFMSSTYSYFIRFLIAKDGDTVTPFSEHVTSLSQINEKCAN